MINIIDTSQLQIPVMHSSTHMWREIVVALTVQLTLYSTSRCTSETLCNTYTESDSGAVKHSKCFVTETTIMLNYK